MAYPATSPHELPEAPASPDNLLGEEASFDLTRMATLGTLACMLAHEMNNLLTPVLSYAKLALDAPADGRMGRRAHENAIRGVEACNAMAESILGFARQNSDGPADIQDCVDQALRCLPRDLAKDGVTLDVDIPEDASVTISTTALVQILLNLMLNARDAMSAGGRLTIRGERSTWNTGEAGVRLSVTDTGCGIDAESLDSIFNVFVSGSGATGCGLGLAICRRLLEEVGGSIRVESRVGEGSTFVIDLPAGAAATRNSAAA